MSDIKVKPPEFDVPEEGDPFLNDKLKRKECAENLTHLLSNIDDSFVLAIDSSWGTGKTIFLRMWRQHLKNEGFPSLSFNAWESDFSEDPFIAMVGEISLQIKEIVPDEKVSEKLNTAIKSIKKNAFNLIVSSAKASLSASTGGLFTLGDCDNKTDKLTEGLFDNYKANKETIEKFKESLSNLVEQIGVEVDADNPKPLIFFIDELDRCRPDFALKLLERVKHLFGVKGVIFILAIDRYQLGCSISTVYGAKMKVDGYLRRFIDIEYRLPRPSNRDFALLLFERFGLKHDEDIIDIFSKLSDIFVLDLRSQEQCFARLNIIIKTTAELDWPRKALLTTLLILKSAESQFYDEYIKGILRAVEVEEFIVDKISKLNDRSKCLPKIDIVSLLKLAHKNMDELNRLIHNQGGALLDDMASYILRSGGPYPIINLVVKKIEFSKQFDSLSK